MTCYLEKGVPRLCYMMSMQVLGIIPCGIDRISMMSLVQLLEVLEVVIGCDLDEEWIFFAQGRHPP